MRANVEQFQSWDGRDVFKEKRCIAATVPVEYSTLELG
jgi:hypothetical protein